MSEPTIGERLAIMDTKLDLLIEQRTDHEARLRSLEKFRWVLAGIALTGGGVSTAVAQALFA